MDPADTHAHPQDPHGGWVVLCLSFSLTFSSYTSLRLGALFNVWNGCIQGYALTRELGGSVGEDAFTWNVALGLVLFVTGMRINLDADAILAKLKAEGKGYQVPRGGYFGLVSCVCPERDRGRGEASSPEFRMS